MNSVAVQQATFAYLRAILQDFILPFEKKFPGTRDRLIDACRIFGISGLASCVDEGVRDYL